jgi:putative zinc finger protein/WD40 repeat protein
VIGHSRGHGSAAHPLSHAEAEALVSARLDAPLTPQQEQRLAAHLATCASCRQFADQMNSMTSGMRSLPRLPASPTVSRQVRERIAQPQSIWERIGGLMGGRVGFAPMAATAAMVALVIAGYALFQGNDDNGRLGPTITAGTVVAQSATQTNDASQVTQTSSSAITPGVEMPTETPVNVPNVRASDETPTETSTTAVLAAEAPTSTATETDTPTAVPTDTATATSFPTDTPTETSVPTDTPEPTATRTPKPEPTDTPVPTATTAPTEVPTATKTATAEPTATKTATSEPTATRTATAEPTATRTPTREPVATRTPTEEPTATETPEPTATATLEPTETPKPKRPTRTPTPAPTATEEPAPPPTIGPADNSAPTEAPPPTEAPTETPVEEPTSSTQIVPVDGTGAAGDTPTTEATAETTAIGGPTEAPNGDQTSNTVALLDDTARIAGISSGGAPAGPLRVNSPGTLMVLSSDAGGSDLQVASMSDGSVVAHLGAGADPIWSPLGIMLLYQSYANGTPSVALYDGDTGKVEPISDPSKDGAVQDIPAGWSGTSAYYLRETGDGESTVILYGYDVNSGETTEIWRSTGVSLSGGRPIPTGDGFLVATTASWLLVGTDGNESNLGPNDFGLTGEGFLSPGASLVAYPAGDQLIVADASSPGIPMAQIPYVNGTGAGFTWSPDGSYLAVSDGYSLQIYDTAGNHIGDATSDNGVTIAAPQWLSDGIYYVETSPTPSLRRLLESRIPGI